MAVGTPSVGTYLEEAAGVTNLSNVPMPPVINVGDVMVFLAGVKVLSGTAITDPGGWTNIDQFAYTGPAIPTIYAAYRVADVTDVGNAGGTLAVTRTNQAFAGQILAFPGVDNVTPQDDTHTTKNNATSTSCALPGVTMSSSGGALLYVAVQNSPANNGTPPTGFTETGDRVSGVTPLEVAYKLGVASGATGTITGTWSGPATSVGMLIALKSGAAISATVTFPVRTDVLIS